MICYGLHAKRPLVLYGGLNIVMGCLLNFPLNGALNFVMRRCKTSLSFVWWYEFCYELHAKLSLVVYGLILYGGMNFVMSCMQNFP